MNALKEFISRLNDDQKMWAAIFAMSLVLISVMSAFTGNFVLYVEKFAAGIFVMFLPGYVIHKLFLNDVALTANRVMDKFIVSLGLSIVTVQTLAFFAEYVSVFGFNEDPDERIARQNYKSLIIVALIIGGAFGVKYYNQIVAFLKKKKD
ncbi:MAG TPA: hypothetical protein VI457_13235 [Methylococcaceae bacterium]|nr:hypothetical protein [Methylococcaceae bacterium]